MPTIASGVNKQLRYKAESSWGTAPGATAGFLLRRVSSDLALKKASFQSSEIVRHMQRNDFRHGNKSVEGTISGELSPGTYEDFIAAAVRKAFVTVTAITTLSLTIAGAGPTYTITRGTGDWISGGIKKGQVGRITAGSVNAANINKNLLVISLTTTVLTVMPLNGVALVAEGPIASCTWTPTGKVSYVPSTGHVDSSFAIEHYYPDIATPASELYLGCKVNQMDVGETPGGMATIAFQMMGKDMTPAAAEYYTTPSAESTSGILAAPNGILVAQGGAIAIATGLNFSIKSNLSAEPVIGSNVYADICEGRVDVDGTLSVLFDSVTMRDYFINETEVSLISVLPVSSSATADFMAFTFPRVKFGDAARDDGVKNLTVSLPFTSLYNAAGGAAADQEQTSFYVQDSLA